MDGSLQTLGGHPHDIDLRSCRMLVAAGHDVHVYCHARAEADMLSHYQGLVPITPLFSINPYVPPNSFDVLAGDILKNLDGARITAAELQKTRPADLWLWPSFYPHQLHACAMANPSARVSVCIHHPPEFFSLQDTAWWRYAFLQASKARLKLQVGFIEPETRYHYGQVCPRFKLGELPFPYDGLAQPQQRQVLKRIGIFGFQRDEKGGLFLLPLVNKLLAAGYEVVIQNSNMQKSDFDKMQGVTRLGYVEDLDEEIGRCDLVLAPYDLLAYQARGSGIVMSALSRAVPVVVPFGSAPGRLVEKTGSGILFRQCNAAGIERAVADAHNDYAAISIAAHRVAQGWSQQHGIARFVQAMISEDTSL